MEYGFVCFLFNRNDLGKRERVLGCRKERIIEGIFEKVGDGI